MHSYRIFLIRIEAALSVLSAALGIVTLFWRDWIEILTGWDPDHHSGGIEIGLILALFAVSVTSALVARQAYRRLRVAT